jgi:predicted transcriptional regulator
MSHGPDALTLPTASQWRAARAALDLTVREVADAMDVSTPTIVKLEAGGEVRASLVDRLRAEFEARGVSFAPDGRGVSW